MRTCLAIALSVWATLASPETAKFLQALPWQDEHDDFGGWSGFDYREDGSRFVALTDRSFLVEGTITRDAGRITGLEWTEPRRLRITFDEIEDRWFNDSEGLAIAPDGGSFVSVERLNAVRHYAADGHMHELPRHPDFEAFLGNGSLEALAIDNRGRLVTLPERSGALTTDFPVYRLEASGWQRLGDISRNDGFLPVGADIGPEGRFYLLERAFDLLGFRTRIRRFDLSETGMRDEEVLLTTPRGVHGNLEGIAVWRAPDGLRATMVSDDNFRPIQPTQIVEYLLPD